MKADRTEPVLRVSQLSVWYHEPGGTTRKAVSIADLTVQPGEVIGICGRSGSGKSTFALAVAKVLPRHAQTEGTIEYRGHGLGSVMQEPSAALHPMLTVGRHVIEAARARRRGTSREHRESALDALQSAGLDPGTHFDAWPHELSGGQKQRVLLAQAFVGDPELIVADEPAVSLDALSRVGIMDTLRALRARAGTAMIFITHTPNLLRGFADRMLIMEEGRLCQYGAQYDAPDGK